MPNWTYSTIAIRGKKSDLLRLRKQAKGKDEDGHGETAFTFENFLPCPKELDEWNDGAKVYKSEEDKTEAYKKHEADLIERFGYSCAYDFHCEVWGTKWDACDVSDDGLTKQGKVWVLHYTWNTAWSPAEPVLIEVSKQYPGVTITASFYEEGGLFNPYSATFANGEKTGEEELEDLDEEDEEDEDEAPEADPKNN